MKNSSIIIVSTLVLVALLGVFYFAGQNQAVAPADTTNFSVADLTASEKTYDFGTISMAKGVVERVFIISNRTASDIIVQNIITSCMCTVAYIEGGSLNKGPFGMPGHGGPQGVVNETVDAGELRQIRVVFDPNAHGPAGVGPFARQILISDAKGKSLQLEIKGNVKP